MKKKVKKCKKQLQMFGFLKYFIYLCIVNKYMNYQDGVE